VPDPVPVPVITPVVVLIAMIADEVLHVPPDGVLVTVALPVAEHKTIVPLIGVGVAYTVNTEDVIQPADEV
jgi:hypothetical protein